MTALKSDADLDPSQLRRGDPSSASTNGPTCRSTCHRDPPIDVTTSHDRFSLLGFGRNVLDLGIFGPAGHELGNAAGFRGWSGGARTGFMLSRDRRDAGIPHRPHRSGPWTLALGPVVLNPLGMGWQAQIVLIAGSQPSDRQLIDPRRIAKQLADRLVSRRFACAHRPFRWSGIESMTWPRPRRGGPGLHRLHRPQHELRQSGLGRNHGRWPPGRRRGGGHHQARALAGRRASRPGVG